MCWFKDECGNEVEARRTCSDAVQLCDFELLFTPHMAKQILMRISLCGCGYSHALQWPLSSLPTNDYSTSMPQTRFRARSGRTRDTKPVFTLPLRLSHHPFELSRPSCCLLYLRIIVLCVFSELINALQAGIRCPQSRWEKNVISYI